MTRPKIVATLPVMRRIALAIGIFVLLAGCDAEGTPDDPRNASECGHHEDYSGFAMTGDTPESSKPNAKIDGSPDEYEKDPNSYTFDFKISVEGIAAESLAIEVDCDGYFSQLLFDQDTKERVGSVEGVVSPDGADGTWALDTGESGTWELDPS